MTELLSPLWITDYALHQIAGTVGQHEPEKGGALMGVPFQNVVTDFIFDPSAQVTRVVYKNTAELIRLIAARENEFPVRFKGILHSHPGSMAYPSGQDKSEFAESLRNNTALPTYISPIVTFGSRSLLGAHELAIGDMRISFFGSQLRGTELTTFEMAPVLVPIGQSLQEAGAPDWKTPPALVEVNGAFFLGATPALPGLDGATILFPMAFPSAPPIVIASDGISWALPWDLGVAEAIRLASGVRQLQSTNARSADVFVPAIRREDLLARSQGLLSNQIASRSAMIVGTGSVGSYMAEALTRAGIERLVLVDHDSVAAHNLGRSNFVAADIGRPKVDAVADLCHRISPDVTVEAITSTLESMSADELKASVGSVDLVIAATDDNATQNRVNHVAYYLDTPALFIGLYKQAAGGEAIMSLPGLPCWRCSTAGLRDTVGGDDVVRPTDYGTGRLEAEPGLLADVHHVTSAAARLALAILDEVGDGSAGAFLVDALKQELVYVVFSMRPNYWFFPTALPDAYGQYAFQCVWMQTQKLDDCSVCGKERSDPFEVVAPSALPRRILEFYKRARPVGWQAST